MRFLSAFMATVLACSSFAWADPVKDVFDSIYGPRIKAVAGTGDKADDLALAKDMLEAARTSLETPALVALLCDASHALTFRLSEGQAVAAEAMTLLADAVPSQRDAAREKLINLLTVQSRTGKPEERDAAGDRLIELLLMIGDEKLDAKQWTEAINSYRRAMSQASMRKSPQTEVVRARLEESMRLDRAVKQIARLEEKLLANANDTATAQEIVKLYLLEMDDPDAAVPILARVQDETLRKIVPLAGRAVGDLDADESLMLGQWYRTQAAASNNRDLWVKTEQYLSRFLQLNTDTGLAFTKATVLHNEAKAKMETLKPVPKPPTPARLPRNPLIAEDKHFGFTGFEKKDNIYTLTSAAPIPAARTKLRYKAHTDGGPHSFGNIHVRLDGRDWVKVGQWSDVSLVESGKNEHWTTLDLTALPANVNARKMEVRFQFTNGGWRMQIYEVQWTTK